MRSVELPFDVLGEIFSFHVMSKGPLELHTILFVTPSWYTAAIHHAHLWTMIAINKHVFEYFEQRHSHSDACTFLRQCLARSGAMPIQLILAFRPSPNQEKLWWEMLSVIKEEEWAVTRRCETLHWRYDDRLPFSRLNTCIPSRLERLRVLYLEGLDETFTANAVFPEFPLLEELHLWHHMTSSPLFKESGLKKLCVLNDGLWTRDDLAAVYHLRHIRWLTLESVHDIHYAKEPTYSQVSLDGMVRPVLLEHLETLELIGIVPKKFLGDLHAPNLANLLVVVQSGGLHSLGELPGCTVHKSVENLRIVLGQRHVNNWIPKYEALVAEMPNLRVISFS